MEEQTRVVVFGSSLNMAGIAASLKCDPRLAVMCVDPHSSTAMQELDDLDPAVIAFDLNDQSVSLDITLLRRQPRLMLLGIEPSSDELLLMCRRSEQAFSITDLMNIIHDHQDSHSTFQPEETYEWK